MMLPVSDAELTAIYNALDEQLDKDRHYPDEADPATATAYSRVIELMQSNKLY